MCRWVVLVVLLVAMGNALAASLKIDVDVSLRGIVWSPDRVVIGMLPDLRAVRFAPIRERELDGILIVYEARPEVVLRSYRVELERLGLSLTKVEGPRRTLYTFRGPEHTVRLLLTERGRETEVRVFGL